MQEGPKGRLPPGDGCERALVGVVVKSVWFKGSNKGTYFSPLARVASLLPVHHSHHSASWARLHEENEATGVLTVERP